jgi:hypothetical protein
MSDGGEKERLSYALTVQIIIPAIRVLFVLVYHALRAVTARTCLGHRPPH